MVTYQYLYWVIYWVHTQGSGSQMNFLQLISVDFSSDSAVCFKLCLLLLAQSSCPWSNCLKEVTEAIKY